MPTNYRLRVVEHKQWRYSMHLNEWYIRSWYDPVPQLQYQVDDNAPWQNVPLVIETEQPGPKPDEATSTSP